MDEAQRKPMWEYTDAVFISGNHLASALIQLGVDLHACRHGAYDDVLKTYGQPAADIWVAWRAIGEWAGVIPPRHRLAGKMLTAASPSVPELVPFSKRPSITPEQLDTLLRAARESMGELVEKAYREGFVDACKQLEERVDDVMPTWEQSLSRDVLNAMTGRNERFRWTCETCGHSGIVWTSKRAPIWPLLLDDHRAASPDCVSPSLSRVYVQPLSADAVDPSAANPGTLPTRD